MTDINHQQARDAAANLAYPDDGYSGSRMTAQWGTRIQRERLNSYITPGRRKGTAPWRNWTLEDSIRVLADRPDTTVPCSWCGELFEQRAGNQKYCGPRCHNANFNHKRSLGLYR